MYVQESSHRRIEISSISVTQRGEKTHLDSSGQPKALTVNGADHCINLVKKGCY